MKKILCVIVPMLLLFVLAACDTGPTPERVIPSESQPENGAPTVAQAETQPNEPEEDVDDDSDDDPTDGQDEADDRVFAIGDTIRVGNIEITVLGYRTSEGEGFFAPADGNVFYLIDVAIMNTGDSTESISSMLMFDLRDSDGFSLNTSLGAMTMGRGGVDGAVLPGKVIRGELGYEIPSGASGFKLQINPQVFGRSGLFAVNMDITSDTPTNPDSLRSSRTGSEIPIGQTFSSGNLEFVVNGVRTYTGEGFFRASEGNTFLLVDVSVTNNGSSATTVSSMLMFSIRDSHGFSYSSSIGAMSAGRGSLDGDVMAGSTLRGELGVEIPSDLTGFELFVSPDVFRTENIFVIALD